MIRVTDFYQNVTGVRIPAGDYADNDERLQGLAGYLVETGHAVVIAPPEPNPLAEAEKNMSGDVTTLPLSPEQAASVKTVPLKKR